MNQRIVPDLGDVADYYSAALTTHGTTARGVDWNSEESQVLRFAQLTNLFTHPPAFSLNDLGCGYGALVDYLEPRVAALTYTGIDISAEMIQAARERWAGVNNISFVVGDEPPAVADFSVASGIFNVRLAHSCEAWRSYVLSTLDALNAKSRVGFAFNCLTSYSDRDKMRDDLYYADPCQLFDHCKQRYSRHVALQHDYGLYEFTILVKKQI